MAQSLNIYKECCDILASYIKCTPIFVNKTAHFSVQQKWHELGMKNGMNACQWKVIPKNVSGKPFGI